MNSYEFLGSLSGQEYKSRFAKWTKRDVPNWYKENL